MVAGTRSPQATAHPPSWQSALQDCGGAQFIVQVTVSPTFPQSIWQGPGSHDGLQLEPLPSQVKLQLVPEQLRTQSWSPVQPASQICEPHTGWHSGSVPGQMGVPPSLPGCGPPSGPPSGAPPSRVAFSPTNRSTVQ